MGDRKKIWFIRKYRRSWWPVSWEGWAVTVGQVLSFGAIAHFGVPVPEVLSFMAPPLFLALLLFAVAIVPLWLSRGHVDKRY